MTYALFCLLFTDLILFTLFLTRMLPILIIISIISKNESKLIPMKSPKVPPTLAIISIIVSASCSLIVVYSIFELYLICRWRSDCCKLSKVTSSIPNKSLRKSIPKSSWAYSRDGKAANDFSMLNPTDEHSSGHSCSQLFFPSFDLNSLKASNKQSCWVSFSPVIWLNYFILN